MTSATFGEAHVDDKVDFGQPRDRSCPSARKQRVQLPVPCIRVIEIDAAAEAPARLHVDRGKAYLLAAVEFRAAGSSVTDSKLC